MDSKELNDKVLELFKSPLDMQAFADLVSPVENWRKIDKGIKLPAHIGMESEDCPSCFETIRLIYDKFLTNDEKINLECPHCKSLLICNIEFTGYTRMVFLEEV